MSHLHHTLPNWLPQTFCLEREHTPQVSCTPSEDLSGPQHTPSLQPVQNSLSWCFPSKLEVSGLLGYFPVSRLLTESGVLRLAGQDLIAKPILLAWGLQCR